MGTNAMGETLKSYACPKCKGRLVRRGGMFYWRGQYFYGQVCSQCNALWDDPDDCFATHVGGKPRKLEVYEEGPTTWERLDHAD